MIFHRILKYCRTNHLTISEFEKMCGIGNGTVKRWQWKKPSLKSLIKVCKATGIPMERWISGVDYE